MTDLEYREMEIREVDTEAGTFSGIAVPYNDTTSVNGYQERIEKGAFGDVARLPLFVNHDHRIGGLPIGEIVEARDTEEGLFVKAEIIRGSEKSDYAYELLKRGTLSKFSVGFKPIKSRKEGNVIVRESGKLIEVSVVNFPAYENAAVSEVRADENNQMEEVNMNDNTSAPEVSELRDAVSDLERKFAVLSENGNSNNTAVNDQYRDGGEALKGLLAGDDAAKAQFRAFTGATTVDTNAQPAWVNQTVRLVQENRDVLNLFNKAPHPGAMSVTLPVLGSTTGTVGVQTTEGADLPYMEVTFSDESYANVTYGGYSSLSRQAIELGTPNYLSTVLQYQALQYAKATNAAVRNAVVGATGTATATLEADTFAGWADLVIDSVSTLAGNGSGANAEFALVSTDVYSRLFTLEDSNSRPLMAVNGDGSNTIGNANIKGLKGNVLGLPVVVDPNAPAGTCIITSAEAVTVMESAGAPVRLQDENIINLTKDFSLYGYMIVGVTNKLAVVKADVTLV